jgi:hypothetical protein
MCLGLAAAGVDLAAVGRRSKDFGVTDASSTGGGETG